MQKIKLCKIMYKPFEKNAKNCKKVIDIDLKVWYIVNATRICEWQWSLKTKQNVKFWVARKFETNFNKSLFLLRVWSWLRMNAGGMPKTCKSNEVAHWLDGSWSACTKTEIYDVDLPPSGARVSNTWVICLRVWNNS